MPCLPVFACSGVDGRLQRNCLRSSDFRMARFAPRFCGCTRRVLAFPLRPRTSLRLEQSVRFLPFSQMSSARHELRGRRAASLFSGLDPTYSLIAHWARRNHVEEFSKFCIFCISNSGIHVEFMFWGDAGACAAGQFWIDRWRSKGRVRRSSCWSEG